jgi:4-hydroxybenzoyl-CoA thioesterase
MIPRTPPVVHFARPRKIRFSDCDPAGIVFFPQYFVMFNGFVEQWVDEGLGLSYAALIMQRRVGLPTVRLEADFRAISRIGDEVTLALGVQHLGGRSLTLDLHCDGADGARRVSIKQVLVTTSLESHKAIEIPADLRAAIERSTTPAAAGAPT